MLAAAGKFHCQELFLVVFLKCRLQFLDQRRIVVRCEGLDVVDHFPQLTGRSCLYE